MLIHILLFALGLVLLIKGGDCFVDGATGLASKFRVPELLIGATVVSIGTTLPEVMVSATSAVEGHGAMAYGNAIGSIICNTALIAAITITIRPSVISRKDMRTPTVFFFIAAGFYAGTAYISGSFTRLTGITLLLMFAVYMYIAARQALKEGSTGAVTAQSAAAVAETVKNAAAACTREQDIPDIDAKEQDKAGIDTNTADNAAEGTKPGSSRIKTLIRPIVLLVLGAALIALGSRLLVNHGVAIAEIMHVPETVIALTFVALGTSLPELVTAITSLVKGHGMLSVGNICGANLFNLVLVSGLSITLGPFKLSKPDFATVMIGGREVFSSLLVDTPLMIIVMLIMTLPALITGKLKRWQGIVLLCLYAAFCVYTFMS